MKNARPILFILLGLFIASRVALVVWKGMNPPRPAAPQSELAKEREANLEEVRVTFSQPVPPTPEQTSEFSPILLKLGKAIKNKDAFEVRACFNLERFSDECARAGVLEKLGIDQSPSRGRNVLDGISKVIGPTLAQKGDYFSWEKVELRRVRMSADGQEAIVIASHTINEETDPIRWWLTKKSGQWQIFDFEELKLCMRITSTMAAVASPDLAQNAGQLNRAAPAIAETYQALAKEDYDAADKAMVPLRRITTLPKAYAAVRAILEASIAINKEQPDKGMRFLDEAERLNPDMPIIHSLRAAATAQLGKYEETLVNSKKYLDILGTDATVLMFQGLAYEALNRDDEAIASYKLSLNASPNNAEVLDALRRVLPKERKKEWLESFKNSRVTDLERLNEIATEASNDADYDSLDAIATMMRKVDPQNQNAIYHSAVVALERKKTDVCIKLLKEAFASKADAENSAVDRIASLLADAGFSDEVYAATPNEKRSQIFRLLAGLQIEMYDIAKPDQQDKDRATIERLIEAHRKTNPKDYWIYFYEAELLYYQNKLAEAETAYVKTLKAIPEAKTDDANQVRFQLLTVLYRLKRGHEAYTQYGPSSLVFVSLASRFHNDNDHAGLKKLLDLHAVKNAKDPSLQYWTGMWHSDSANDAEAILAYRAYLKAVSNLPKAEFDYKRSANSEIIRSLVRLGQFDKARAELKTMKKEGVDEVLETLIAAASGDVDATLKALHELVEVKKYHIDTIYLFHDDIATILRTEKMKPVRDKYPEPKREEPKTPKK